LAKTVWCLSALLRLSVVPQLVEADHGAVMTRVGLPRSVHAGAVL
jgi:hypothetical protein